MWVEHFENSFSETTKQMKYSYMYHFCGQGWGWGWWQSLQKLHADFFFCMTSVCVCVCVCVREGFFRTTYPIQRTNAVPKNFWGQYTHILYYGCWFRTSWLIMFLKYYYLKKTRSFLEIASRDVEMMILRSRGQHVWIST